MTQENTLPNVITDDMRFSLLVTALEGGSNYWYFIPDTTEIDKEYPETKHNEGLDTFVGKMWNAILNGASVEIIDVESEEFLGNINYKGILVGEGKMIQNSPRHFADILADNMDAITADVWFQYCVMGEVVYG
jgi:hypothetical protein